MDSEKKAFSLSKFSRGPEKGFHITFANGWTVSVQFGNSNYCDNRYNGNDGDDCNNAEVWRWDKNGDSHGEDVSGYMSADEVLRYMNETASK